MSDGEVDRLVKVANRLTMERNEARADVARLTGERDEARLGYQRLVDAVCHYRNLALELGAQPENMLNDWDRKLAQNWSTYPKESERGEAPTTPESLAELSDTWDEIDALRARLAAAEAESGRLREALRDIANALARPSAALRGATP